jgi:hypothetical protein
LDNTLYTSKHPIVSIFAATIGIPSHDFSDLQFLKWKTRFRLTLERLLIVERFGRMRTLLKSSLIPSSILGIMDFVMAVVATITIDSIV